MTIGPTIKVKSFFRANGDLIIVIPKRNVLKYYIKHPKQEAV